MLRQIHVRTISALFSLAVLGQAPGFVAPFTASQLCLQYDEARDRCVRTTFSIFSATFSSIVSSKYTTCGIIRTEGGLGQLRDTTHGPGSGARCFGDLDDNVPRTDPGRSLVAIDVGMRHRCAIDETRLLNCWGKGAAAIVPDDIRNRHIAKVACGDFHTCVLLESDSTVRCFGENSLVVPSAFKYRSVQVDANALSPSGEGYKVLTPYIKSYDTISAGSADTCGLKSNGTVQCWGGIESLRIESPPSTMLFESIDLAGGYACGIIKGGASLHCWGAVSSLVRNGIPSPSEDGSRRFRAITAGERHACVLLSDNEHHVENLHGSGSSPLCFGDNTYGQLDSPSGEEFLSISAGSSHTCGLRWDFRPVCWGRRQPLEGMVHALTEQKKRKNIYD